MFNFMDNENFEQSELTAAQLGDAVAAEGSTTVSRPQSQQYARIDVDPLTHHVTLQAPADDLSPRHVSRTDGHVGR